MPPLRFSALLAALVLTGTVATDASAQGRGNDNWEQLGCEEVGRRSDRDVIKVGRREGRFKAIRLSASGNDVRVEDLKVVYVGGGAPDDIRVRAELREGANTAPLDLKGRERAIDSIELTTKRDFKGRGKGKICVSGLQDDRKPDRRGDNRGDGDGKWEQLGCQNVGLLADRDTIKVGRREGRFKAIRLEVSGNSVYINDLKVIYTGGGAPDDLRVRSEIREGGQSGPLDLKGRERAIDRIELAYRAKPNFKGSARVCVSGRD